MKARLTNQQLEYAGDGYDPIAPRSASIAADCYIESGYLEVEREQIFRRSWQFPVPRGEAARARQLCHRPRPGPEHRRDPRRGRRVARLLQCLQAPRTRAAEGRRHDEAHHLSVPRVGLRPRRPPAPGPPLGADRGLRSGSDLPHARAGGSVLPPRVREPGPSGARAWGADGQPCPRSGDARPRPRRPHLRASPDLYRARELEGGGRQLPRVLPLSCRAPGLRDPGGDGYLQGHHPWNLVQSHGPGGSAAESGLRRGRSERDRPRGLVPVAEHGP